METLAIALLVTFPLVGAASRVWTALVLPLVGWPLFYSGLDQGWWGNGLGDGWEFVAACALLLGVASTALAVGLARRVKPRGRARLA